MSAWMRKLAVSSLVLLFPLAVDAAEWRGGIGVVGDSYSDEYQFYPPCRSKARNWVEILASARGLDFGPFSTQSRGEPRNQGFGYNWARSEATTEDAVAQGQHLGLAAQVARGEVGLVMIFLGGNDFIHALDSSDPTEAIAALAPAVEANLRRIVDTTLAADADVKVVVATVPNVCEMPMFAEPIRLGSIPPERVNATTAAIRRYNSAIRSMAFQNSRIAVMDLDLHARIANLVSRDFIPVGGRRIDRARTGESPTHAFLTDGRHAGTVGQGLLARAFIQTVNARFGAAIPPLMDREILAFAEAQFVANESPGLAGGALGPASTERGTSAAVSDRRAR